MSNADNIEMAALGEAITGKGDSGRKRGAEDPSSPSKIEKMDETDGAAAAASDEGFDFDLDKIGEVEFEVQDIVRWRPGLKSAAIKVQYVSVRYGSVGVEGKKQSFKIVVEDTSGKTTLCSFADDAKKLKAAVSGREGSVFVFTNLLTRSIEEARFQVGKVAFEFQFQKVSEVKDMHVAGQEEPIQKLQQFASIMGPRSRRRQRRRHDQIHQLQPLGQPQPSLAWLDLRWRDSSRIGAAVRASIPAGRRVQDPQGHASHQRGPGLPLRHFRFGYQGCEPQRQDCPEETQGTALPRSCLSGTSENKLS